MTIAEMETKKKNLEKDLKLISGNSKISKQCRAYLKEQIERIEMSIFKLESPEQFENWKNALQGYVENTHIF